MSTNVIFKRGLRARLAETYIALIGVAVLVMWSLDSGFRLAWTLLGAALWLIARASDFLGIPYVFDVVQSLTLTNWRILGATLFNFLIYLTCAWLLSQWAYGVGPFRALRDSISKISRRSFVNTSEAKSS